MHVLKVSANTQDGIQETQHPMMCQLVNNFIFKTFCSVFSKVLTFKKANFTKKKFVLKHKIKLFAESQFNLHLVETLLPSKSLLCGCIKHCCKREWHNGNSASQN